MNLSSDKNLYLVLTCDYRPDIDPVEIARQAISGGISILQMREKTLPREEIIKLGQKLACLCSENKVTFIVNDDPYIAKEVNADGVHLGQEDLQKFPIKEVRKILGKNKIIGVSTHSPKQFETANAADVDYLAYGPIFHTKTKSYHIGTGDIDKILETSKKPVVLIGGINSGNIDVLLRKGAKNIAVIRSIIAAENIAKAAQDLKCKLN